MAEDRDKQSMGESRSLAPVGGGYGYTLRVGQGPGPGWFGPLDPLSPAAPPSVKGRILDYASGYNLQQRPRPYEPITFAMLRQFADSYDLLRLIIETRKDQLGRMRWNIVARSHAKGQEEALQPLAIEIEKFFVRPDKEHFWDEWLRMILEDMFVLDAPAIYRRKTMGGELYALQPIDGGTIKRVIDGYGNTPEPPNPAYQQILKGMAAVDYTTEDLLYRPRNVRTHKIYGYSPVEQVIMTVQIALRRQIWQLQSFTEGNVPEALIGVPGTWTPDQVRMFQDWFDSQLQGNTGERRRARFVPGEIAKSYVATKTDELFGAAEEWLARVLCFAFSISPQPFIKMMNRATAETAQETAVEEGLAPIQNYIKNLIDTVIIEDFKCEDLEFEWAEEDELDPNIKSQILDRDSAAGRITINQAREANGLDPYPEPEFDRPMLKTASGWVPIALTPEEKAAKEAAAAAIAGKVPGQPGDAPGGGPPGDDGHDPHETADDEAERSVTADQEVAEKGATPFVAAPVRQSSPSEPVELGKSDTAEAHGKTFVNPDRAKAKKAERKLRATLKTALALLGQSVSKQLAAKLKGLGKADDQIDIDEIIRGLTISFDTELADELADEIKDVYATAGEAGLAQLGVQVGGELFNQVNERSVEWAADHAADLVGRSEASWIADATRDMLRVTIATGIEDNLSAEDIASNIEEAYAFSEERASLIAMTEVATANSEGALAGYEEAQRDGISVKKSWLILEDACDDCQENEDAGAIDLDEPFPSGDDAPPAHPNCRCVLVPEVEDEDGNVTEGEEDDTLEMIAKGDWNEEDHPRDEHGKFGEGGVSFASYADSPTPSDVVSNGEFSSEQEAALNDYSSSTYEAINSDLRSGEDNHNIGDKIGHIDEAIAASETKEDTVVYRGFSGELPKEGDTLYDKAFVSTSTAVNISALYTDANANGGRAMMAITLPAGTNAIAMDPLSVYPNEKEMLLGRGSGFTVTNISTHDIAFGEEGAYSREVTVIHVDYVPPPPPNPNDLTSTR